MLIGSDHVFDILKSHKIKRSSNEPIAFESVFGYIIAGPVPSSDLPDEFESFSVTVDTNCEANVESLMQNFWLLKEVETASKLTEEELFSEQQFESSFNKDHDGTYELKQPFKCNPNVLGNSYPLALARLNAMESKFKKNELFRNSYCDFMTEYETLGYMKEVHPLKSDGYYLPHHGVLKNENNISKIRVVCDGTAKPKDGNSLNDILAEGPTVQDSLFADFESTK